MIYKNITFKADPFSYNLEFDDRITLVGGDSGTGKTVLYEILEDISKVIGARCKKGVVIEDVKNLEASLKKNKPDVAIITTMSLMNDIYDVMMICAKCGVNAISTCEEAFFPANSSPKVTAELDKVAKANNCTLTGSGYQTTPRSILISTTC